MFYDINDFDEAVVAPCSLDLVRCATSILLASELWHLTPLQASGMVLEFLDKYESTVVGPEAHPGVDARAPRLARGPIWEILGRSALADQAVVLDKCTERVKNGQRRIIRSKDGHPSLKSARVKLVRTAVEEYGARLGRSDFFKTLDVTGRIAGVGSLGVSRYTVLVAGGGSSETNRLFDLKKCLPSALGPCTARPWPFPDESDAARVVRAQRMLQAAPTAGLDVLKVGETPYRVRELIPAENRSSLSRFNKKPGKLRVAVEAAGLLTALCAPPRRGGLPGGGWGRGARAMGVRARARLGPRRRCPFRGVDARRPPPVPGGTSVAGLTPSPASEAVQPVTWRRNNGFTSCKWS